MNWTCSSAKADQIWLSNLWHRIPSRLPLWHSLRHTLAVSNAGEMWVSPSGAGWPADSWVAPTIQHAVVSKCAVLDAVAVLQLCCTPPWPLLPRSVAKWHWHCTRVKDGEFGPTWLCMPNVFARLGWLGHTVLIGFGFAEVWLVGAVVGRVTKSRPTLGSPRLLLCCGFLLVGLRWDKVHSLSVYGATDEARVKSALQNSSWIILKMTVPCSVHVRW